MKFDRTKPCANCPFRCDIPGYLTTARVKEIAEALEVGNVQFPCHKTMVDDGDEGDLTETESSQHCAGALIQMEKINQPTQMMRIMERLRMYDPSKLQLDAPVHADLAAFVHHHATASPYHGMKASGKIEVTMTEFGKKLLRAINGKPKTAGQIGLILWPHLTRRGNHNGGPSASACAAAWQIGKFQRKTGAKYVYADVPAGGGLCVYGLTRAGQDVVAEPI